MKHESNETIAFPKAGRPALVLAPMEGVTDAPMRALMSERSGFSYCVSEFLRVNDLVPPDRTFKVHIPESLKGWKTSVGTVVQVQLLGGNAEVLAETARRAAELGAPGIDLNFGCPAPTVNRHDGGATLLKYPHRIRGIVEAVRRAVPAQIPVSAKLRLGFDSMESIDENAEMAAQGGASWITIHGRTKTQGYRPPAYWDPIGRVRARLGIPVVANGEIWTLEDFKRCREETGSLHFMIGRGALGNPGLVFQIAKELGLPFNDRDQDGAKSFENPSDWLALLSRYIEVSLRLVDVDQGGRLKRSYPIERYVLARIKQWLNFSRIRKPLPWFDQLKRFESLDEVIAFLQSNQGQELPSGIPLQNAAAPCPTLGKQLQPIRSFN
ncbi:MAG: tRNA-dihydrouridine synthase family protein [Bdellovibrionales bacterium]|nr:tRNA-dihydrouridine synthase family protein [Bdellovibrionales bacterium]